ncbi:microcystin-dependent protein [Flavobacterium sp. 9]|uniref:hypothetical protein n=1 Tax=Flavobacterium sp. 9 TaxID=2035198 RepID=UPI000C19564C|nr:hypothetical protein [Flavobacterium sp. 9]PIF32979.1 microcystin-dependent protein [Flavobacterium sp. 9]
MDFAGFQNLIAGLGTGEKNTALEMRTLLSHLIESIYLPGDIKEIDCTNEYVEANFTETGLGINERAGWARCNGLNGTRPRGGRTSIGCSDEYPVLGALGGSKTHLLTFDELPEHDHDIATDGHNAAGGGSERTVSAGSGGLMKTKKTGGNQPHNNMQPFIVSFFIQKL